MKNNNLAIAVPVMGLALVLMIGCAKGTGADSGTSGPAPSSAPAPAAAGPDTAADGPDLGKVLTTTRLDIDFSKYQVTFIELGADRCIPCRKMQPVMAEIAEAFAGRVQVVFYDVWKDPAPGEKYGVQLIPTQVFVDRNGKEISRHVGFFPKEGILELLKKLGVQ